MEEVASHQSLEVFGSKSLGEYAQLADRIKVRAAQLLDEIKKIPVSKYDGTVERYRSLAETNLENSVMWAVKACSRV